MELIKEKISERCKAKKISLKTLSAKIGMTQAGLIRAFKNKSLKVSTLIEIANFLDLEPAYLINDKVEVLIEGYRKLSDSLISVIINVLNEYVEFISVLQIYSNKNLKVKKEINEFYYQYYTEITDKRFSKYAKNQNKKSLDLLEIFNKRNDFDFSKETLNKGMIEDIYKRLKEDMSRPESLFHTISELDKDFDLTMIDALYEYYINSSKNSEIYKLNKKSDNKI